MARPPRLLVRDGTYHVTARGNNSEATFREDHDRSEYLRLLGSACAITEVELLAYVLMDNHVHLVVHTSAPNLHEMMHRLQRPYAREFNRRYHRVNHLFGDRYYSRPIVDDVQLLEATRYVHANPVRAGLVQHPGDYPWSSFRDYVQPQEHDNLVRPARVLELLAIDSVKARAAYETFVCSGIDAARICRGQ